MKVRKNEFVDGRKEDVRMEKRMDVWLDKTMCERKKSYVYKRKDV